MNVYKWDNLERETVIGKMRWVFSNNEQEMNQYILDQAREIHRSSEEVDDIKVKVEDQDELVDENSKYSLEQRPMNLNDF
mmetsp:Transcript_33057/g.29295  ORF Transcript_33057/g.29295 Transcript_33057/m.29295 type:complete len:80 (-) Transcript_33057:22-261(-)